MEEIARTTNTAPYKYTDRQRQMARIHDARRTAILSSRYYAQKLNSLNQWGLLLNIAGAVGGSAALLNSVVKVIPDAVTPIGVAAALLSAIAPLLGMSEKACRLQSMRDAWQRHAAGIDKLISSIATRGELADVDIDIFTTQLDLESSLSAVDEPDPDHALVKRLTQEIELQFPADRMWMPTA